MVVAIRDTATRQSGDVTERQDYAAKNSGANKDGTGGGSPGIEADPDEEEDVEEPEESEGKKKPLMMEVFRTGTHTSSEGHEMRFTNQMVDEAIASHNNEVFRVPLIVSHETSGIPDGHLPDSKLAFGVVDHFKRVGSKVYAVFKKYSDKVKSWIADGQVHSISSSFYLPEARTNPHPGKLSFRHIALLGSEPPAVKGMAAPELAEQGVFAYSSSDEGSVSFSSPACAAVTYALVGAPWQPPDDNDDDENSPFAAVATALSGLRDMLIAENGVEAGESTIPAETIRALSMAAAEPYVQEEDINPVLQQLFERLGRIEEKCWMLQDAMRSAPASAYSQPPQSTQGHETMTVKANETSAQVNNAEQPAVPPTSVVSMAEFEELKRSNEALKAQAEASSRALVELAVERRRDRVASIIKTYNEALIPCFTEAREVTFTEGSEQKTDNITLSQFLMSLKDWQLSFFETFAASMPAMRMEGEVIPNGDFTEVGSDTASYSHNGTPIPQAQLGEYVGKIAKQKVIESRKNGINLSEIDAVNAVMGEIGIPLEMTR
jgi:hypothetical protein